MSRQASSEWKCLIGGAGKWKKGPLLKQLGSGDNTITLEAKLVRKLPEAYVVELSWQPPELSFAEIIEMAGDTPLPPYIKRKPSGIDSERYQTIYAKNDGSVAAPTAGLHFSPRIFSSLQAKHISVDYVTLHVGAGTFKPVKAAALADHEMHSEWMDVPISSIHKLRDNAPSGIIAVGTTSLRTIESIYWMGVKAFLDPGAGLDSLSILQWEVYEEPLAGASLHIDEALTALIKLMERNHCDRLIAPTQLLIAPGYQFRLANALITNFHQPQSTLLLLVAAAIGEDWRKLYSYALDNGLRFLSYGDGSLIFLRDAPVSVSVNTGQESCA
jgi:S-adenosylmethionine:tRNA ribosyltransferase-isomerase